MAAFKLNCLLTALSDLPFLKKNSAIFVSYVMAEENESYGCLDQKQKIVHDFYYTIRPFVGS